MSYNEGFRCHWCGNQYANREFYPACSQDHRDELIGKVNDGPCKPREKEGKIKLWVKFVNHQYAAWSALFELITGFEPPKMKEILAMISGH